MQKMRAHIARLQCKHKCMCEKEGPLYHVIGLIRRLCVKRDQAFTVILFMRRQKSRLKLTHSAASC